MSRHNLRVKIGDAGTAGAYGKGTICRAYKKKEGYRYFGPERRAGKRNSDPGAEVVWTGQGWRC